MVRAILPQLTKWYTVIHQTGPNQKWELESTENYKPYPYINEEMPHVMAAAEIIMGRSGAGIWEWAACGKPMVLIPLRGSGTRGDQVENAEYFKRAGAAIVLKKEEGPKELGEIIEMLANNAEKRQAMAQASLKTGGHAASLIISDIMCSQLKKTKEE